MATDVGPWGHYLPLVIWSAITRSNRVLVPLPPRGGGQPFVESLKARIEAGQFRAVIDRSYPLDGIAEAYRYVATGQTLRAAAAGFPELRAIDAAVNGGLVRSVATGLRRRDLAASDLQLEAVSTTIVECSDRVLNVALQMRSPSGDLMVTQLIKMVVALLAEHLD